MWLSACEQWLKRVCECLRVWASMTHAVTHDEGQSHGREWVMDVRGRGKNKPGHIPPWLARHRKAPADYTAGVETQELPHVRRWVWLVTKRLWRPVKLTKVGASKGFTHFLCHHRSHEFLKKRSFHDRHVTDSMMEGKEEEALWRIKLRSNTPSHCIITCDKRGVILYNFMPCVFSCFCIHHARLCGNISTLLFEMTGLHGHEVLPRGPPWVKPPSESVATNYMVSHYTGVNKAQTLPFGTAMSVVLATVVWLIRNIETTNSFL